MEHVVDACLGRKRKSDSDVVDDLHDPIRTQEAGFQLARCSLGQRGRRTLSEMK
jgi:hypothetical protein